MLTSFLQRLCLTSGSECQILTSNFVDVKLRRQIFDVFDVPQAQFQGLGAQIGVLGAGTAILFVIHTRAPHTMNDTALKLLEGDLRDLFKIRIAILQKGLHTASVSMAYESKTASRMPLEERADTGLLLIHPVVYDLGGLLNFSA